MADAAGYTKGAVYSNFASKEDLFLAVYERRADKATAMIEQTLASAPDPITGIESISRGVIDRQGRDGGDGWLAVFFEFWAHVLRHPELRARFAAIHRRPIAPVIAASEQVTSESGAELGQSVERMTTAYYAMQLGLQLERLTQPEVVDADLAAYVARRSLEDVVRGGANGSELPPQATRGRGRRNARRQGAGKA